MLLRVMLENLSLFNFVCQVENQLSIKVNCTFNVFCYIYITTQYKTIPNIWKNFPLKYSHKRRRSAHIQHMSIESLRNIKKLAIDTSFVLILWYIWWPAYPWLSKSQNSLGIQSIPYRKPIMGRIVRERLRVFLKCLLETLLLYCKNILVSISSLKRFSSPKTRFNASTCNQNRASLCS